MDVIDNSRFDENVDRHRLRDITQVTFCKNFLCQNRHLKWRRRNLRSKHLKTHRHGPEARHEQGTMMTIIPRWILERYSFHDGFVRWKYLFQGIGKILIAQPRGLRISIERHTKRSMIRRWRIRS